MEIVLTPILDEPIKIIGSEGKTWLADPTMTGGDALFLMKASADSEATVERWAAILSRGLVRHHPEMTPERVLDTFPIEHIGEAVYGFLSLRGRKSSTTTSVENPSNAGTTTTTPVRAKRGSRRK